MARRGFSLIELMVVIAIVALLATVGTPIYKDYVVREKIASVIAIMRSFDHQVQQYVMANNSWPYAGDFNIPNTASYVNTPSNFSPYLIGLGIVNGQAYTGPCGVNGVTGIYGYISGAAVGATFTGNSSYGGTTNWLQVAIQYYTTRGGTQWNSICGGLNSSNTTADYKYLPPGCQQEFLTLVPVVCT